MNTKKLPKKESVAILIFSLVFLASLLVLKPVFSRLDSRIKASMEKIFDSVEKSSGLSVSYSSLSPAVFSGVRARNIVLKDTAGSSGREVLSVKSISLHYSFLSLVRGDFDHLFKNLTVDGITLSLDKDGNSGLFSRLKNLFPSKDGSLSSGSSVFSSSDGTDRFSGGGKSKENPSSGGIKDILDFLKFSRLFDIYIKNVRLRYSFGDDYAEAFFRRISFNVLEDSGRVSLGTSGSLSWNSLDSGKKLSCGFSADGNIDESLDGSSVAFHILDFTDGNFNLKRLNLLFSYSGETASFMTVQNPFPFAFSGSYSFASSRAELSLRTSRLEAGKIISSRSKDGIYKALDGMSFSLDAALSYSFVTESLSYSSGGNVFLPASLFEGGGNLGFSFSGDENLVSVERLDFSGERLNADFSGSLVFDGLKFSGALSLYNYTVSDGNEISAEVFFEPKEKGFMAFSPQLMLGEKSFTALQLDFAPSDDSFDFSFELSDYAHTEYENPGKININGSYLLKSSYVQASLSASDLFSDSVFDAALFFAGGNKISSGFLSPYLFNGELYLSSDFRTLSFNMPYLIVANTKRDDQFVFASASGSGTSVTVSRLDFISGGKFSSLSSQIDFSLDTNEAFLTLDASHDSVPYHLSGAYIENIFNVSGDYGFSFEFRNLGEKGFSGSLFMENLPFKISESIFTFNLDSSFSYSKEDGINVSVSRLEAEDAGSSLNFHPHLFLSGNVTKYGAIFSEVSYSDRYSALNGPLSLTWNINDGIFSSANLDFRIENEFGSEGLEISAEVSNPALKKLDSANMKDELYFSSQIVVNNLGLSRFLKDSSDNNRASATFIASGTWNLPYIAADISSVSLMIAGNIFSLSGTGYAEGKDISVSGLDISYSGFKFNGISAEYNLSTFTGNARTVFETGTESLGIRIPLEMKMSDTLVGENGLPEDFIVTMEMNSIGGSLFAEEIPASFTLLHSKGETAVYSSDFFGISGYIAENGDMDFSVLPEKIITCSVTGNAFGKNLDININDVNADLSKAASYLNLPDLKIHSGILKGDMRIGGLNSDPSFDGGFVVSDADISLPNLVPSHITSPEIKINLSENRVSVPEFKGNVRRSNPFFLSLDVFFDRWVFDRLEANLRTPENVFVPVSVKVPAVEAKGNVAANLDIVLQDIYIDVTGSVVLKDTNAKVITSEFNSFDQNGEALFYVHTDLDIFLAQHVSFAFEPVLRAVFVPDTRFGFKFDTEDSLFNIDGDVLVRSGDIAYLNRNFYLKNGIIRFNPNENTINPYITMTAETREKDEDGNDVRIILSANNQPLNDFQPIFTSIPPKSETEIREILGQIAVGDSDKVSSLLIATGDYAIQSTLGRTLENALREYLNFDIFSLRTNVLQNAIRQTLSSDSAEMKIGNYLDNSTVYIGKYFGSSLYADALMHVSYEDSILGSEDTERLTFQPEIGFEMDISQVFAPLWNLFLPRIGLNPSATVANVRFSLSPELGSGIRNINLASSTSVTLSWKFSF